MELSHQVMTFVNAQATTRLSCAQWIYVGMEAHAIPTIAAAPKNPTIGCLSVPKISVGMVTHETPTIAAAPNNHPKSSNSSVRKVSTSSNPTVFVKATPIALTLVKVAMN